MTSPHKLSLALAVLLVGLITTGGLGCFGELGDDQPEGKKANAKDTLRSAASALGDAKGYAVTWRFDLELSDSNDHERDKTAFFQQYDVRVHGTRLEAKELGFYRDRDRSAIRTPRGYRGASGHTVGKWLVHLLVRPEVLLREIRSCRPEFPSKDSQGARVVATLSPKVATLHWERVVQSRCIAGQLEDVPVLLSRVDPSRTEGTASVRLDPKTSQPIGIDIIVAIALASPPGAPKKTDPKADWREEEHLVVRQKYDLSQFGEVAPIEIPSEAHKALAR